MAPPRKPRVVLQCAACGKDFEVREAELRHRTPRFCSAVCEYPARVGRKLRRDKKWPRDKVCETCQESFHARTGTARFCSRECLFESMRGEKSANWKGGRLLSSAGYVQTHAPDHPAAVGGYVLEHRLVMEASIGRYLYPWETVHHKNGNKEQNDIDNLQLRTGRHGKGVALRCADCGSCNIVPEDLS